MSTPPEQMTEDELLARARAAAARATAAGTGTLGWSVQWAVYDTAMTELDRRAIKWAAGAPPEALRELGAWLAFTDPRARRGER